MRRWLAVLLLGLASVAGAQEVDEERRRARKAWREAQRVADVSSRTLSGVRAELDALYARQRALEAEPQSYRRDQDLEAVRQAQHDLATRSLVKQGELANAHAEREARRIVLLETIERWLRAREHTAPYDQVDDAYDERLAVEAARPALEAPATLPPPDTTGLTKVHLERLIAMYEELARGARARAVLLGPTKVRLVESVAHWQRRLGEGADVARLLQDARAELARVEALIAREHAQFEEHRDVAFRLDLKANDWNRPWPGGGGR